MALNNGPMAPCLDVYSHGVMVRVIIMPRAMSVDDATVLMGISCGQVYRLKKALKAEGPAALISKQRRGSPSGLCIKS